MTDPLDRASELEEMHRERSIKAHQQRAIDEGGDGCCIDCGEAIDPRRLAANPLATRCTEHQSDSDRRQKVKYGRY